MLKAKIRCKDKRFPFGIMTTVLDDGVRWYVTDETVAKPRLLMTTSTKSARKLATWILANTEEES